MFQGVDHIGLVEVVDPGAAPLLQVADQLEDGGPLVGKVVPEPETPEDGEEVVDLLHVLVRVEYEEVPGVAHHLTLRQVEDGQGAGLAAQGEAAGGAPHDAAE